MAKPGNLTLQLAAVADALGPVLVPVEQRRQLVDVCAMTRLAVGAASVSIGRLDGDELVFDAADGVAADEVTGMRVSADRGIAGYVARTGQSLVVDDVGSDPRFARDVAERVGFVPTSLLVVPISDDDDAVLGVISVLDRTSATGDPLAIAALASRLAAPLLTLSGTVARLGPMLVRAVADAVEQDDTTLVPALRRLADTLPDSDAEIATYAALLAEMRSAPPATQQAIARVLREMLELATPRRRW